MDIKIPSNFNFPNDYHMTIKKGELSLGTKMSGAIGSKVELKVNSIGVSENSIAVGVQGLYSKNKNQHITIAFKNKPSDSNNIENWIPLENPFKTFGFIRETERKEGFGKVK